MTELDCTSIDTALPSVAGLMRMSTMTLAQKLLSYSPREYEDDCNSSDSDSLDVLWWRIFRCLQKPVPESIMWFHATRVRPGTSFADGIRPLNERLGDLEEIVKQCAKDLGLNIGGHAPDEYWTHSGGIQFSLKTSDRMHWGPYAFLMREVILPGTSDVHDYLSAPEIVEDIARRDYGPSWQKVLDRFRSMTVPCIVHFRDWKRRDDAAAFALRYCHKRIHERDNDAILHTCYDAAGVPVSPSAIVRVEYL
ncbi:hypothetical protein [Sorangium atrum]|uniref:Uncharacterized protein n=1 Tax=Sorangium atrum TaxID=2995308 RepID=A0ABT5CGN8_9BACT|nr:hypothetical protein [Sorangium aterium]MDC0685599.1 hypothetical protein [Sorangium aterium]